MNKYTLPVQAKIGRQVYDLHADYREILQIFSYLEDPELPEPLRWRIALGLFYEQEIPRKDTLQAMEYLAEFLRCGEPEGKPGPKLLDWQQDADAIIAGVNKVAGQEVRALSFVHWWTFLSWFHSIGQGQLSTIVAIRDKLRRGKKLEAWEKDFYRENKARVDLQPRLSRQEQAEKQRLEALLK